MNNPSRKILILLLLLSLFLAITPTLADKPTTVEVTDMAGRNVTLPKLAERVVALAAADCEILYAIGAGDKLVGRGEYCDYPAEITRVQSVESGSTTNIEQIIALNPDVVIMPMMAQSEEQVATLENAGIPVFVTNAQNIDGIYQDISLIGSIVGRNDEAHNVITSMKEELAAISSRVKGESKAGSTVYFEVSPLEYGLWTAGSSTFMDEIASIVGLKNIFSDIEGWASVSEEQVIERNPDYIVTITMYSGEGVSPIDEIKQRSGWSNIKAIADDTIIMCDSNEMTRPGPRIVNAAQTLFDHVYVYTK